MSASRPLARLGPPLCLALLLALFLAGCAAPPAEPPTPPAAAVPSSPFAPPFAAAPPNTAGLRLRAASFADLPGWDDDDFAGLWTAWQRDCQAPPPALRAACGAAATVAPEDTAAQRAFFLRWFQPWQASTPAGADGGLVTGYFEPVFQGSTTPQWPYIVPVYGLPADLVARPGAPDGITRGRVVWTEGRKDVVPYWSRAQLDADPQAQAAMARNAVVWLASAVDALFLQVQGSGLVQLPDGQLLRLSYAGDNGWPYRSVGRWLLDNGELRGTVTMQIIRAWAEMHPERVPQMLEANPRIVFFRSAPLEHAGRGPTGALGVPLTPMRSVAVDRSVLDLGLPLWLSTRVGTQTVNRLVFAQDVGGAINGALRADLFFGTGEAAGDAAGRMQSPGHFWVLLPRGPNS